MLTDSLEAARLARSGGRWHEALACYEAAIPIAARHGSPDDVADLFLDIGDLHRERGDLELAAEAFGVAVAISEANGEQRMLAMARVLVDAEIRRLVTSSATRSESDVTRDMIQPTGVRL